MKDMELCERFFFEVAQPVLKAHFPTLSYTAGLIGYGSDVLGYDDEVSTEITDYYGREIKVVFCDQIAEAVQETLNGTAFAHIPLIGSMSEVANFSVLSDDPIHRERIKQLYQ